MDSITNSFSSASHYQATLFQIGRLLSRKICISPYPPFEPFHWALSISCSDKIYTTLDGC